MGAGLEACPFCFYQFMHFLSLKMKQVRGIQHKMKEIGQNT